MTANSSGYLQILIFVLLFGWILSRRFQWRPVRGDSRQWRMPLILIAIGLFATFGSHHSGSAGSATVALTDRDYTYLAFDALLSVAFGLIRGFTLRIAEHDGRLMKRYRPITAGLWIALILIRGALDLYAGHAGVTSAAIGNSIMLMFGISLLGESVSVTMRTAASGGARQQQW
jgi:hypothetical protein